MHTCFGVLGSAFLTCTSHSAQHADILHSVSGIAASLVPVYVQGVLTSVHPSALNVPKLMMWP